MKIFLICFAVFFSFLNIFASQNYWISVPSPVNVELFKFAFSDSLNLWAAGDSSTIIHTSDGGNNWVKQNSSLTPNYRFTDLYFLNRMLGWGIAFDLQFTGTVLIKTTNGGTNWFNLNFPDTNIYSVYFIDSLNGFLGDYFNGGLIWKTTNAGANWFNCSIDTFIYYPKVKFNFYNQQVGVLCGGSFDAAGPIWKTTNSGFNWIWVNNAGEPVNDVLFLDSNTIFGTGGDFEYGVSFCSSSDNGVNWKNSYLGVLSVGKAIAPRTRNEIWIALAAGRGGWVVSFDSTKTWDTVHVGGYVSVNDTRFCDPLHGWAVGSGGAIYKFNKDAIGIHKIQTNTPDNFVLYQNYPNPFNPTTKIKFSLPEVRGQKSEVRLVVYDILGREVSTLVNEKLHPGTYEVEWPACRNGSTGRNGSNYPSGVYFYRLQTETFSETRKMVLMK